MRRLFVVWTGFADRLDRFREQVAKYGLSLAPDDFEPEITRGIVDRVRDGNIQTVLIAEWSVASADYSFQQLIQDLIAEMRDREDFLIACLSQRPPGDPLYGWLASRGVTNLFAADATQQIRLKHLVRLCTERMDARDPDIARLIDPSLAQSEPTTPERDDETGGDEPGGGNGEGGRRRFRKPAPAPPMQREGREPRGDRAGSGEVEASGKGPARIVAVGGYKGGVGRTTVAASLAARIASVRGERVAAVDLHWDVPMLACHFGFEPVVPAAAWQELCHGRLPELPRKYGVAVLAAPGGLDCDAEELRAALERLSRHYDCIVLDMPPNPFDPAARVVAAIADRWILVTNNDPVTVERNAWCLRVFRAEYGLPAQRLGAVGNLWEPDGAGAVPEEIVAATLGSPEVLWLGHVPRVTVQAMTALAAGMPLALAVPDAWAPIEERLAEGAATLNAPVGRRTSA